jgi:S1-C subfamily serine protease
MDLPREQQGALVIEVTPGSPAAKAGLLGSSIEVEIDRQEVLVGGDVITGVDQQAINDFEDLVAFLARYTIVGQTLTLEVIREGEPIEVPLTLEARPVKESPQPGQLPGELSGNAWLGIQAIDVTPEIAQAMELDADTVGALVQQVSAGSPADEAGIRGSFMPIEVNGEQILIGGDIIVSVGDSEVDSVQSLSLALSQYEPGDKAALSILRNGEMIGITVTLAERPSN